MKQVRIGITIALVALAALGVGLYAYKNQSSAIEPGNNAANLVRFHSPSMGANDAKVVIVEFLDPSCEACRAFYPIVKSLMAEHEGKARLVVRYAPFHKGSDVVIGILEAARLQGMFWPTLEAVFRSQPTW